jgi:hypothetical protein
MSEKIDVQVGSGVCIRCYMSVANLTKHDWDEHRVGVAPIAEKPPVSDMWREFSESFVFIGDKPDNRSGK